MMLLPTLAIRQPWAFLIVQSFVPRVRKDIENRSRAMPSRYVGRPVLVLASAAPMFLVHEVIREYRLRYQSTMTPAGVHVGLSKGANDDGSGHGGIVGVVRFAASIRNEGQAPISPWADAESKWWWPVLDARPLPFAPCKGQLGVFWREYDGAGMEGF